MLTREDLEKYAELWNWAPGLDSILSGEGGRLLAEVRQTYSVAGPLLTASPKLAMACLEAHAFAQRVLDYLCQRGTSLEEDAQDVRSLLFKELTAAGVEVP